MWRLILAFLSLSVVCCQSELFRDDIRSPENVANVHRLIEEKRQREEQQQRPQDVRQPQVQVVPSVQHSELHPDQQLHQAPSVPFPTLAPLQSPSLVSGFASQSDPVNPRFGASAIKQPYPISSGLGATHVDLATSEQISRSVLLFAYNLGQHMGIRKTEIFSPLSIVHSLALLYLGARERSYNELAAVFKIEDTNKLHQQFGLMLQDLQQPTLDQVSPGRPLTNWRATSPMRANRKSQRPGAHEVHLANGLFTATGFTLNPDYRTVLTELYGAELEVQDFEGNPATSTYNINRWVAEHTRGHIKNIIASEIPQSTRMILANALYFRGFWETDFIESATRPDNFYPNGEGTQPVLRVQLMATGGTFPYHEDEQLGCRIIGLPYRGNLSTMYIIQPLKSSKVELMALQRRLSPERIEELISRMYRRSAIVAIPKMHLTESVNLKTMMQNMGLGGIFSTVENDLSLIASHETRASARRRAVTTNSLGGNSLQNLEAQRRAPGGAHSDLVVDDIVHKVDFNVNEQGTEAAAATITYLKKSGPDVIFRVDTPFMVLVRHDPTKLVLFYGLINEPPATY
ncbi:serine protease inhibitor 28Dc [Drosophila kikkawai]|uniref:Serine protease inhibitor 28Dc n=1 Tax=Drosophila kikkawai TaxID=30033 RepID=A0A6P4IBT3_DROKI|nr:serine protease inhibitor 28Dc [Drosophila kikkawai]